MDEDEIRHLIVISSESLKAEAVRDIHETLHLVYKHLGLHDEKYEKEFPKPNDKAPKKKHLYAIIYLSKLIKEHLKEGVK